MNVLSIAKNAIENHPDHMSPAEINAVKPVISLAESQIPEYSKVISRCNSLYADLAMIGGCFTCAKAKECNGDCPSRTALRPNKQVARIRQEGAKITVFYYVDNGRMRKSLDSVLMSTQMRGAEMS